MLLSIYQLLQIISCIPCVVHYILELILYPTVCTFTSLLPYCPSPLVTTVCSMSLLSFLKNHLFIFGCAGSSLCCTWAFSSCRERGLLSSCGAWVSHCCGFSYCGAWALGAWASEAVARGLSCPVVCVIFPDQGSNQCPLHCKADS